MPLYISVTVIRVEPPGYFIPVSVTTPIVSALKFSALKNYYYYIYRASYYRSNNGF
jgi:hypothetical protein